MKRTVSVTPLERALGLLCLGAALGACSSLSPVVRTVDGVASEGRFIEPEAYAFYTLGALREAHGQYREALGFYQRALDLDGAGPEIRTRVAAVACKLGQKELADSSFSGAFSHSDDYAPAWFELALCKKSRGELAAAAAAAQRALELDPERHETSLLAADLAELQGDSKNAWRLRDALATHAPTSTIVQRAILSAAERAGQRARAARAQASLEELSRPDPKTLSRHDVTLALDAIAKGDALAARREAELVLDADPANGDALVIALAAADLSQDHAGFARLLESASEPFRPASPAVLATLEALLARRINAQAAGLVRPQP